MVNDDDDIPSIFVETQDLLVGTLIINDDREVVTVVGVEVDEDDNIFNITFRRLDLSTYSAIRWPGDSLKVIGMVRLGD